MYIKKPASHTDQDDTLQGYIYDENASAHLVEDSFEEFMQEAKQLLAGNIEIKPQVRGGACMCRSLWVHASQLKFVPCIDTSCCGCI